MDRELIVGLLAEGLSVEAIGKRIGKHRETVAYWMAKYGLEAPNREKHAAKGGIARDELERLVIAKRSIAQIAEELEVSKTTVRYWLGRHGLRTSAAARPRLRREVGGVGGTISRCCERHGETEHVLEGRGYYRCARCRAERVSERRRAVKATLVAEAGGCCAVCGYDRCARGLQFHHLDPTKKRYPVCNDGRTIGIAALREEAQKCVLLCANCHAEVEAGMTKLSLQFPPSGAGPPADSPK